MRVESFGVPFAFLFSIVTGCATGVVVIPDGGDPIRCGTGCDSAVDVSAPETCVPDCTGRTCGDDGCGGSCGECGPDERCDPSGGCRPTSCIPNCPPHTCGADGCGGMCPCGPTEWCDPTGWCACRPDCTGRSCGPDGCGGSCGTCVLGLTCTSNGMCEALPNCTGRVCGPDGAGGSCGTCPAGQVCNASGACVCVPNCTGRVCGPNGCGGSCGTCPSGQGCSATGHCDPCAVHTDCSSCAGDSHNCGWCDATHTCIQTTDSSGTSVCPAGWAWSTDRCSICLQHHDCTSCSNDAHNCGWCSGTHTCIQTTDSSGASVCSSHWAWTPTACP